MAPEQASGTDVDARADLYSLGVVAYELCSGRVPFTSDSTPALIHDQVYTLPPAPSQVNSRVTGSIETILLKALSKDRDQRYQSGQEFATALSAAITQATGEHLTTLYQEAAELQQHGDFDAAETKLLELLAIQPGHAKAQALLKEVGRQRESQQRYQQLASQVKQMQVEAAELQRINPALDDPAQILSLLVPSDKQPAVSPAVSAAPLSTKSRTTILMTGLVLFIAAVILAIVGIQKTQEAVTATFRSTWDAKIAAIGNTLAMGNFLVGVSVGVIAATLICLVIFAVTSRTRSKHG
jgi:serine/threonine protein kinase